jgi:hypothetical protein
MGRHLHERPRLHPVVPQRHARAAFIVSNPGESNRLSEGQANSPKPRTGCRHRQACAALLRFVTKGSVFIASDERIIAELWRHSRQRHTRCLQFARE